MQRGSKLLASCSIPSPLINELSECSAHHVPDNPDNPDRDSLLKGITIGTRRRLGTVQRVAGNKDEGIGVGGWTILWPWSSYETECSPGYSTRTPTTRGSFIGDGQRERERGSERDKEKEQKTSVLFQPRCSGSTKGEIIRRIEEMKQWGTLNDVLDRARKNNETSFAAKRHPRRWWFGLFEEHWRVVTDNSLV